MTADDLRLAVIDMEKQIFYEKTNFESLTGDSGLNFTSTGRYDKIYEHIHAHKYYQNLNSGGDVSFSDSLVSWYREIYNPIVKIINKKKIANHFPGKSGADLYIWIVRHWDFTKKKQGDNYSIEDAAKNFSARYGLPKKNIFGFIASVLSGMRNAER